MMFDYDEKVFNHLVDKFYRDSDFYNMGFWLQGTLDATEACENLMEKLLSMIPYKTGTILDVACGKGATTRYLKKYFTPENITAINISDKQVEYCRAHVPDCKFIVMDATQLDFEDNSFDHIICVEAAFHFNTRRKFLREAYRILKPGGCLVLSDLLMDRDILKVSPFLNEKNYIADLEEYKACFSKIGFEDCHVLDATLESSTRFYNRLLRFLEANIARRGFNPLLLAGLKQNCYLKYMKATRHYVLAGATKPLTANLEESREQVIPLNIGVG